MKDNEKRMLLKQWVSGFMGGIFAFMVMFNMGAWASVTNSSGISAADQAKLDAMTESGGDITFTGNVDFSTGFTIGSGFVASASDMRMAAGWRVLHGPSGGTADGYEVVDQGGGAYGWDAVVNDGTVSDNMQINFGGFGFEAMDLYATRRLGSPADEDPFVLRFGSNTTYTLDASGDASMSGFVSRVVIAANSGTADDWDSASTAALTGTDGGMYYIQADAGDTITIRDASAGGTGGNIETTTGANIVLTGEALALAFWDETASTLIVAPLF